MSGSTAREPEFPARVQIDRLRREMMRLVNAAASCWVFVVLSDGEIRSVEHDETAVVDQDHPLWPKAARSVSVDDCMTTVAACQRDRFYGRLAIAMQGGAILAPPMKRGVKLLRLLP